MLKIDEQEYERGGKLKLLGTVLTEDNDITADIKFRIIMANETMVSRNSRTYEFET